MAIKPATIRATDSRSISTEEEQQLNQVEADIDLYLQTNFADSDYVCFVLKDELSMVAKRELLRRYREVGWRVLAFSDSEGVTTLYFAEGSPSALEPPQRLSLTAH